MGKVLGEWVVVWINKSNQTTGVIKGCRGRDDADSLVDLRLREFPEEICWATQVPDSSGKAVKEKKGVAENIPATISSIRSLKQRRLAVRRGRRLVQKYVDILEQIAVFANPEEKRMLEDMVGRLESADKALLRLWERRDGIFKSGDTE